MNQEITVYSEFESQLAQWKADNSGLVFDYEDPSDNKAARSHVYKLRQTKGAIEAARKDAKAAALEYGRKLDARANEIKAEIDAMIDVHAIPLAEIEQREKDRVQALADRLAKFPAMVEWARGQMAPEIADCIARTEAVVIDDQWQERTADAGIAKDATLRQLRAMHAEQAQREAEQAELERLRREASERAAKEQAAQAERDRQERDAQIARDAEERATRAAEARRQVEAREQARREEQLKAQAEADKQARIAAEERAARAESEAKARAECEHQANVAAEAREAERRERNTHIRNAAHRKATEALIEGGVPMVLASQVVILIADGKVPGVAITY